MIRKVINSKILTVSMNLILIFLATKMFSQVLLGKFYSEDIIMLLVGIFDVLIILLQSKFFKYRGIIILSILNVILNAILSNLVYTDQLIWSCYIGVILSIFLIIKFPKITPY